jgi:hypothetical protein
MFTGVATVTALVVAGPNAALKTLSVASAIKTFKNRKKARPRPGMKYNSLVIALVPLPDMK